MAADERAVEEDLTDNSGTSLSLSRAKREPRAYPEEEVGPSIGWKVPSSSLASFHGMARHGMGARGTRPSEQGPSAGPGGRGSRLAPLRPLRSVFNPWPSVFKLLKPLQIQGFLKQWTATVSKSVSHGADGKTIRHYWLELAETSPPLAFTNAVENGLEFRFRESSMKSKFNLFRRGSVFYMEDTATGKQTSLRTKDETEAKSLLRIMWGNPRVLRSTLFARDVQAGLPCPSTIIPM